MHGLFLAHRPGREKAVNFGYLIPDAALQTGKGKIRCALGLNLCGLLTCEFIPSRLPLRSSYGLHAPYALRTIVELESDEGVIGITETYGGEAQARQFESLLPQIL